MSHPCCICDRSGFYSTGSRGAGSYCHIHRKGRPIDDASVEEAKRPMSEEDRSLAEAAHAVGTNRHDLDQALWNNFGRAPAPRRYRPDFVA